MSDWNKKIIIVPTMLMTCLVISFGCRSNQREVIDVPPPTPLGHQVDQINRIQQNNADAAKFVIPMHEFELNDPSDQDGRSGWRLNGYGEDHVKQIAASLKRGNHFPVIVERSQTSVKPGTKFEYPVHFNSRLDETRRQLVVTALNALGVVEADKLVIVSPSFAEGYSAQEAAAAYTSGIGNSNSGQGQGNSR